MDEVKGRGHAKVLQGHTVSGQKLEVAQHHDNQPITHTHTLSVLSEASKLH